MQQSAINVLEQHAQAGAWSFDPETRQLWWSEGIYRLHDIDPAAYVPTLDSALSFYVPESRARLDAAIAHALAHGSGWNLTLDFQGANGEVRRVHAVGRVEARAGRAPLLVGALFDVHEQAVEREARRALEQRLAEQDIRWRVASENAGLGLIEIDFSADRYCIRGALVKRIGLSETAQADIPRRQWLTWIHDDDRERRQRQLDAHMSGENPSYLVEYRLCLPQAEAPIWVKEAGAAVRSEGSFCFVGILSDVSERKRGEVALRQSQRRLTQTLRHAPIGIALVSPDGRWLTVNRALCQMLGYSEAELLGTTYQDLTPPDELGASLAAARDLLAGRKQSYRIEKRYIHKHGHMVDIQLDVCLLRDDVGEPLYFISQMQDITERKRIHQALFEANELAEITFESIGEGVIRMDRHGMIRQVNTAAAALLGTRPAGLLGRSFDDAIMFYHPDQDERVPNPLPEVLASGERSRVAIFTRLLRPDGRYLAIADSLSPIHDDQGGVRGAVFVFQDVSEARRVTDELNRQASQDALTGLANRRGFEQALAHAWQRVRSGMLRAFVMYLDLDHFKAVNDNCGHAAGDELLRQIGFGFRDMLRDSDVLARLGGDEFAAIVHAPDAAGARLVAEKFLRTVASLDFRHAGRTYAVGVSIGIAALDATLDSADAALSRADTALYEAKAGGRSRYHLYRCNGSPTEQIPPRVNIAFLLRSGLEQDRFALCLQRVVDTHRRCVGYEVSLRFSAPAGMIEPDVFLPVAKRQGLMSRIDCWLVKQALTLIAERDRRGLWPRDADLNIGLSPVSLADPGFHAELLALLTRQRAHAHRIVFQIPQSEALLGDQYPQLIRQLRDYGCRVWIDDFTSGGNGFDILKRVEVDGLKIGHAFVRELADDSISRAVLSAIIDISRTHSLCVTAASVDGEVLFDVLKKAGVTRFQGCCFHRPEPAGQVLAGDAEDIRERCQRG